MLFAWESLLVLIPLGIMLLFSLVLMAVVARNGHLWFQAYMSGVPIGFFTLVGMRFRRINAKAVVHALIMARQAGVSISCADMEKAYLQGVDLEKITLAMIEAKQQGLKTTFHDLLDAELRDRLDEKLGGQWSWNRRTRG
jgi:uncharacterized protein YqfA (UPF0365 family)